MNVSNGNIQVQNLDQSNCSTNRLNYQRQKDFSFLPDVKANVVESSTALADAGDEKSVSNEENNYLSDIDPRINAGNYL